MTRPLFLVIPLTCGVSSCCTNGCPRNGIDGRPRIKCPYRNNEPHKDTRLSIYVRSRWITITTCESGSFKTATYVRTCILFPHKNTTPTVHKLPTVENNRNIEYDWNASTPCKLSPHKYIYVECQRVGLSMIVRHAEPHRSISTMKEPSPEN